jgi:LysR family transcriptional regulator, nitrogen assimilation regulatory protein
LPNIAAEADMYSSIMAAVRSGIGNTILPKGDLTDVGGDDLPTPLLIEPPLYLTASIISSSDFPLTHAGEAVRKILADFTMRYLREKKPQGAEWIGGKTAISSADSRISK